MAKKFKILLMLFAIGIYIVPKQIFYAQTSEMPCCEKKIEKKSCCESKNESKKPCHKNEKHDCNGNCNSCNSCHFSTVVFNIPNLQNEIEISKIVEIKKVKFIYIKPEFSDIFSKIWQPPKIS